MTKIVLCQKCGVSRATLYSWFQTPNTIRLKDVEVLAGALKVDEDDIIC